MLNNGYADRNSTTQRPSSIAPPSGRHRQLTQPPLQKQTLAEWLRTITRDLFQVPGETAGPGNLYAGLAAAPGVVEPAAAAAFSGQLTRLQTALNGAASAGAEKTAATQRRAAAKVRQESRMVSSNTRSSDPAS